VRDVRLDGQCLGGAEETNKEGLERTVEEQMTGSDFGKGSCSINEPSELGCHFAKERIKVSGEAEAQVLKRWSPKGRVSILVVAMILTCGP